jgi:hypothetical protein
MSVPCPTRWARVTDAGTKQRYWVVDALVVHDGTSPTKSADWSGDEIGIGFDIDPDRVEFRMFSPR